MLYCLVTLKFNFLFLKKTMMWMAFMFFDDVEGLHVVESANLNGCMRA